MSRFIYPIILVIFSIIAHIRWFFVGVFAYHDWKYSFEEIAQDWTKISNIGIWSSFSDFGTVDIQLYFFPLHFLRGMLSVVPNADYWGLFFLYFVPIIVVAPISIYFLFKRILHSELAAFLGSITYIFATPFLGLQTEHLTIAMAYTIIPLFLLTFVIFLQDNDNKINTLIIFAVVTSIAILVEPRIFYITLLFLLPSLLFIHKFFARYMVVALIIILLNLFWILPMMMTGSNEMMAVVNRPLFGNSTRSLAHSLSSMATTWSGFQPTPFEIQPISMQFWVIPIFVFSGLFFIRKQKQGIQIITIFVYIVAIVGIFLVKQSHEPFPQVYGWLYEHFPGFHLYRESSKFYILILISYAYLISFTFFAFSNFFKEKSYKIYKLFSIGTSIMLISIFVVNVFPLINGNIGGLFIHREIPNDYLIFKDYVLNQNEYFRTQGIPRFPQWGIVTLLHPSIDTVHSLKGVWKDFSDDKLSKKEQIEKMVHSSFFDYLLDVSSIKYVYVPIQDFKNDADFFRHYGGQEDKNIRAWYVNLMDDVQGLNKINIGTEVIDLYENKNYKPFISTIDELYMFDSVEDLNKEYDFMQHAKNKDIDFIINTGEIIIPINKVNTVFAHNGVNNLIKDEYLGDDNSKLYVCSNEKNRLLLNNVQINDEIILDNLKVYKDNDECASVLLSNLNTNIFKFTYGNSLHIFENKIKNPSFENGLWTKNVEDCNKYDENVQLIMKQSGEATDGKYALELQANTHTACTNQDKIMVKSGSVYLFNFDYQSPNAKYAKYYIRFDNGEKISQEIPIVDSNWHTVTKYITIPENATTAQIFVYGNSDNTDNFIITRYDNFHLINVSDIKNKFLFVDYSNVILQQPQNISFEIQNATKYFVHVSGVTKPFYLIMSEKFHDKWQLQFNNDRVNGLLRGWMPFIHPNMISKINHFKYMTFLNGWYVDPQIYCQQQNLCKQNDDGSYDMELSIEFLPQRWFYLGLFIGGITLLTLLISMMIIFYKKYEKKI
jgi:hypothetical protein